MGSWNGTCMISNLPITYRDRIKLVILHSPHTKKHSLAMAGYCYTTDILRPAFFPISGTYNDYGGIEEIDNDWSYKLITSILKLHYNEIEVEKELKSDYKLEDFIFGIERGSLKVFIDSGFVDTNFSYVMIREDIWDGIVKNEMNIMNYWNEEEEYFENGERNYYIDAPTFTQRKINKSMEFVEKYKQMGFNVLPPFTPLFEFSDRPFDTEEHGKYIINNISEDHQILKDMVEMRLIRTFLESIRKGWMVQAGAGSQTDEIRPYLLLCDLIKEASDKLKYDEDEE
jgi:hypothetical protein